MTKKIFRSILFVSLVAFIFNAVLITFFSNEYFDNRLVSEFRSEADFVMHGVKNGGNEYLSSVQTNRRITIFDCDGNVKFDNTNKPVEENPFSSKEIKTALKNGSGYEKYDTGEISTLCLRFATVFDNGDVLRIEGVEDSIWTLVEQLLQPMFFAAVIIIVIAVLLARLLSNLIVKPINNINLESPEVSADYEELSPLLHKISRQNTLIGMQMSDIRKAQEEFKAITENMSEGFLLIDNKSKVLSYNKSILNLLGVKQFIDGDNILTLNRSKPFKTAVEKSLGGSHCEQIYNSDEKTYQIFANPVKVDGHISGSVIVMLDITEKEQRDKMRREFTSNVSHELKTPLTTISGISELMVNGIVKPEDNAKFAKDIHDEAQHIITLVNDIIKLSRLDENSFPNTKQNVDIFAVAKEVVERLQKVASDNKISLSLSGNSVTILGQESLIFEMIYNLSDNAIKYNNPQGSVNILVGTKNSCPFVSVADTGIGVPKQDFDRIFERFYRVDKSHSRAIGGTGLGLSIVKHGAAYHNAKIKMDSTENKGTKITIIFDANK